MVWRYFSQKSLRNELGLQYELDKDKQKLEIYSNKLENLVEERTKKLNKSELMFRSLFKFANDGIMILDRAGGILNVNKKAMEIHGFEKKALLGINIKLLEVEENRLLMKERIERIMNGEALVYETQHYRKDGSKVSLEISAKAIDVEGELLIQAFQRDVTEKKKLQAHLMQSQKMDSIGLLAGGIAHDFNNILTGILGYTELILEEDGVSEGVLTKARVIENSSLQAATMVSKLLSFSRRENFEPVTFDVNSLIQDTSSMLTRLIPKQIDLHMDLAESLNTVEGDISQIEQVIMNLVLNARDAMPDGGALVVKTGVIELGPKNIDIGADIVRGRYVNISVSDTGSGIDDRHLPHIFEPFYTTKEKGKGTGLGLAMVYGIIKEHRGYITVSSSPKKGTTFDIFLPVSEKREAFFGDSDSVVLAGGKTILVIDDEIPVLEYVKEALQKRGFNIIVTDNPLNGLAIYRKNHQNIDLVITDMIMPLMKGGQLIQGIKEVNPRAGIVVMTGFSDKFDKKTISGSLKKPFTTVNLLKTLKEAFEAVTEV